MYWLSGLVFVDFRFFDSVAFRMTVWVGAAFRAVTLDSSLRFAAFRMTVGVGAAFRMTEGWSGMTVAEVGCHVCLAGVMIDVKVLLCCQ